MEELIFVLWLAIAAFLLFGVFWKRKKLSIPQCLLVLVLSVSLFFLLVFIDYGFNNFDFCEWLTFSTLYYSRFSELLLGEAFVFCLFFGIWFLVKAVWSSLPWLVIVFMAAFMAHICPMLLSLSIYLAQWLDELQFMLT